MSHQIHEDRLEHIQYWFVENSRVRRNWTKEAMIYNENSTAIESSYLNNASKELIEGS